MQSPAAVSVASDGDKNHHDFKNQLAIITGLADLLPAEAAPGDKRRADLEDIHKAATTALHLLTRLYPTPFDSLR